MENEGVKDVVRKTPDALLVKRADGSEVTAFLGNLLIELNANPTESSAILSQFVSVFAQSSDGVETLSVDTIKQSLMPAVRSATSMREALIAAGGDAAKDDQYVSKSIAADYVALLAIDRPESISIPGRESLAHVGLGDEEMFEIAIRNLEDRMKNVQIVREGGVSVVILDQNYESSVLLADNFWRKEQKTLKDEIVAVAPARDILFFCAAGDANCIATINAIVEQNFESLSHSISAKLIKWDGARWRAFN